MRYLHSRRIRIAVGVVLAVSLAATGSACGRGGSGSTASGAAKIAIVTRDFTNPYWPRCATGPLPKAKNRASR